jgi:hypothetical protein
MKNFISNITALILLIWVVSSCADSRKMYMDYSGEGESYAQFTSNSFSFGSYVDADGDLVEGSSLSFPITVKLLGPAPKSDVKVGIKILSATGTSGVEWALASSYATIPAGSVDGSVNITINKDKAEVDKNYTLSLQLDDANSDVPVYTNGGTTATVKIFKSLKCDFDISLFEGEYVYPDLLGYGYQPAATITNDGVSKLTIMTEWDELPGVKIIVNLNPKATTINKHEVTAENQDVWSGSLTGWGLSSNCTISFEDFNSGIASACTGEFSIACTPMLYDNAAGASYWWGGEFVFAFTKDAAANKSAIINALKHEKLVPFKKD